MTCAGVVAKSVARIPVLPLFSHGVLGSLSCTSFICKIQAKQAWEQRCCEHETIYTFMYMDEHRLTCRGLSIDASVNDNRQKSGREGSVSECLEENKVFKCDIE